jgi:pilus assembly protein CpaE
MEVSDMTEAAPVETNRARRRPRIPALGSLQRREDGVITIEFALLAPMLAIGTLALGMVALHVNEQADLDHILRAGTHAAIQDMGHPEVLTRMKEVAQAKGYEIDDSAGRHRLILTSVAGCACPDSLDTTRVCNTACPDGRPALRSYTITASYISGPVFVFGSSLRRLGVDLPISNGIFQWKRVLVR